MLAKIIEALNTYSNLIIAMSTVILVAVTTVYAYFTLRMTQEMERTRIADLRAYITVDIDLVESIFYLVIRNRGKSAASDVRLSIDKEVEGMWRHKLTELPLFQSGVAFFNPGKEYVVSLGSHWKFLGEDCDQAKFPKSFEINADYIYLDNHTAHETTLVNLVEYMHTRTYPDATLKTIQNIGEVIGKQLTSLVRHAEKISKLEDIVSPTGLDLSQGTLCRLVSNRGELSDKIRFDLNLTTLMELTELLGIESAMAERIIETRYSHGYFASFDELNKIEGMSDKLMEKLRRQTFISKPNY